jgi:hypothetical protein
MVSVTNIRHEVTGASRRSNVCSEMVAADLLL